MTSKHLHQKINRGNSTLSHLSATLNKVPGQIGEKIAGFAESVLVPILAPIGFVVLAGMACIVVFGTIIRKLRKTVSSVATPAKERQNRHEECVQINSTRKKAANPSKTQKIDNKTPNANTLRSLEETKPPRSKRQRFGEEDFQDSYV